MFDEVGSASVGEKVQNFLDIDVIISLVAHSDQSLLDSLLIDVPIALASHRQVLDSFVPGVFSKLFDKLIPQNVKLCEFLSVLEHLLDNL